jgi:hypothetical protein
MIEPRRFKLLRRAFARRDMGSLSLVAMVRIVIEEWFRTEIGNPKDKK